ncbi:Unconventional myosin heavy chain 6 [Trichoplax sp. H2]|nr:Unconventional myosin heavy chain 6 [Trichoplax sp. H2]|eukprot:RDD47470.1 Unconventional myosin heavy chain 6 [Trichoplax sp. H2]
MSLTSIEYTYAGTTLLAINPCKPLKIYEIENIVKYSRTRLDTLPPHIFAIAQSALHSLRCTQENQCYIIAGDTGSGKTEATRNILQYLCTLSSFDSTGWMDSLILEALMITEAFGNAKTSLSPNASRRSTYMRLYYNDKTFICGCKFDTFQLETNRLVHQPIGERNFNIFYYLLGASTLNTDVKKLYNIDTQFNYNLLCDQEQVEVGDDENQKFSKLRLAMNLLSISPETVDCIFRILSAILSMTNFEFEDVNGEACRLTYQDLDLIEKIAHLLGISQEAVAKLITIKQLRIRGVLTDYPLTIEEAKSNCRLLAKLLYEKIFNWVIDKVNAVLAPPSASSLYIGILDISGFEAADKNTFQQLCTNYINEKLHNYIINDTFINAQQAYANEEVDACVPNVYNNIACLSMIESTEENSIISTLHVETVYRRWAKEPNTSYVLKQHKALEKNKYYVKNKDRRYWKQKFGIEHYNGRVLYSVDSFLQSNKLLQNQILFDTMRDSTQPLLQEFGISEVGEKVDNLTGQLNGTSIGSPKINRGELDDISSRTSEHSSKTDDTTGFSDDKTSTDDCRDDKSEKEEYIQPESNKTKLSKRRNMWYNHPSTQKLWKISYGNNRINKSAMEISANSRTNGDVSQDSNQVEKKSNDKLKRSYISILRNKIDELFLDINSCNRWYIRCLKPNLSLNPETYDEALVTEQLRYSDLISIILFKKQGYPIYFEFKNFLEQFRCLVSTKESNTPSSDLKAACVALLDLLPVDKSDWLCGRTKIFLRQSAFDSLEDSRKALFMEKVVTVQRLCRGMYHWKRYLKKRQAAVMLQKHLKGRKDRIAFLKKKKAAIVIQSYWRGAFARELAKEIRYRRQQAEEEKKRKQLDEDSTDLMKQIIVKPEKEEDHEAITERRAQRELYTLIRMAELNCKPNGKTSLEDLIKFIKGQNNYYHHKIKARRDMQEKLVQIYKEMDVIFNQDTKEEVLPKATGSISEQRRNRIKKAVDKLERKTKSQPNHRFPPGSAHNNPATNEGDYSLVEFARLYFNDHNKDSNHKASGKKTLKRSGTTSREELLKYTSSNTIHMSHIHIHDRESERLACSIFKDLNVYLHPETSEEHSCEVVQRIVGHGINNSELRDEIYVQIIRQGTENPKSGSSLKGWCLMALCAVAFPPSKLFSKYLVQYLKSSMDNVFIGHYASWCKDVLRQTKIGARRHSPSKIEFRAVQSLSPLMCQFYLMDCKSVVIEYELYHTASDVTKLLAKAIGLQNYDGWALYESTPDADSYIRGHEFLVDVLAQWEIDNRTSAIMRNYNTQTKERPVEVLGAGDARFILRKRIFLNPKALPQDLVEHHLIYAQAVHDIIKEDKFPITNKVAFQLAGLQAQVCYGDYVSSRKDRYTQPFDFLSSRIIENSNAQRMEDISKAIAQAHKDYGYGLSEIQAKVIYLTCIKQYQLYGATLFEVTYKGFWMYPNHIYLAVDHIGFKFVNYHKKEILASYPYSALDHIGIDFEHSVLTLNVITQENDHRCFMFETNHKDCIASLIVSYSPTHNNWLHVQGGQKLIKGHVNKESRVKSNEAIISSRRALANSGLLRKFYDKPGLVAGSITRFARKFDKHYGIPDEKLFKSSFWTFSKIPIKNSLTKLSNAKGNIGDVPRDEIALEMFSEILAFGNPGHASRRSSLIEAGRLTPDSNNENGSNRIQLQARENEHELLAQQLLNAIIADNELCNEFYLQIIKQTTDHPDPTSRVNTRNWQLLSAAVWTALSSNKLILDLLSAHLNKYMLEANTDQGKYAQFCLKGLARVREKKNRKFAPSIKEIKCLIRRRPMHARFYFMDGEFRALEFDSVTTIDEITELIKRRIGLLPSAFGFSLYECRNSLERSINDSEKVADVLSKWDLYSRVENDTTEVKLTFKKRLYVGNGTFYDPEDRVEFDLLIHQASSDIINDKYPLYYEEAVFLCALRAQAELGDCEDDLDENMRPSWVGPEIEVTADYGPIVRRSLPRYLHHKIKFIDVKRLHRTLVDKDRDSIFKLYMEFVKTTWSLYGSTVFDVTQTYTSELPKTLWLAVSHSGVYVLIRRAKEPRFSFSYSELVSYKPSLTSLMLIAGSLTNGRKFVFNTNEAVQIALLIRDYTHYIVDQKKHKSV